MAFKAGFNLCCLLGLSSLSLCFLQSAYLCLCNGKSDYKESHPTWLWALRVQHWPGFSAPPPRMESVKASFKLY